MNPSNEITLELFVTWLLVSSVGDLDGPRRCWSSASNKQKTIADDDVWLLPPTVLGFSLSLKVGCFPSLSAPRC